MLNMFIGFDQREAFGSYVFINSIRQRATIPVNFHLLDGRKISEAGSNNFTMQRFLVPYLMGFKGRAIFADGADMVCLADIRDLWARLHHMTGAAAVVKHAYKTRNQWKYIGTEMESINTDYERKNWASLMLIDCEHEVWRDMTPAEIYNQHPLRLLQLKFIPDDLIEALPAEWNVLADEGQDIGNAKLLHWTAGIPGFPHYANAPGSDIWKQEANLASCPLPI
jgi:hypothetical protein